MSTSEWPKITADVSQTYSEDMYRSFVYTRGATKLVISERGNIFVKPGDSLGLYSWVLYGDYKQLDVFCRFKNGQRIEIQNKNLIYAGETLVHYPGLEAHRNRVNGIREARDNPPVLTFTPTRPPSYSDWLCDTVTGVVVTAVAIDDHVTELCARATFNEVRFDSISSFVDNIISKAGNQKIRRLHVYAHGFETKWILGNDELKASNFAQHRPQLERLRSHLAPHGWVIMHSCKVGQALPLLRYLTKVWNVHVIAGIGDQRVHSYSITQNFAVQTEYNKVGFQIVKATGEEYTRSFFPPQLEYTKYDLIQQKTLGAFF